MDDSLMPDIAGTYKGSLVIVGSGSGVWGDLINYNKMKGRKPSSSVEGDVMCINDMICYYPGYIHHAYTNNEKRLDTYWANRRYHYKERFKSTSGAYRKPLMHTLSRWNEHIGWPFGGEGTSALNACRVAVALGYDDIVLCGLPMDESGHFWEAPWERPPKGRRPDEQYWNDIITWHSERERIFRGKVKSMSGNTRDLLGSPDDSYYL